jgi:flavin-dependent dehydrogenase
MGGLINRRRGFTSGDGPLVIGAHALGDAHTATNPLYGRGCSLAMVQAGLLARSLRLSDPLEAARDYEEACRTEIHPWYRAAVAQDRTNRTATDPVAGNRSERSDDDEGAEAGAEAGEPTPETTRVKFARSLLRDGVGILAAVAGS